MNTILRIKGLTGVKNGNYALAYHPVIYLIPLINCNGCSGSIPRLEIAGPKGNLGDFLTRGVRKRVSVQRADIFVENVQDAGSQVQRTVIPFGRAINFIPVK